MSQLPLPDAIPRFKANEERIDVFVNGADDVTYTTSDDEEVSSIRKFLKDKDDEINVGSGSILSATVTASDIALGAQSAASTSATNAATAKTAAETAQGKAQDWAESPTAPGGVGTKSAKTYATEAGANVAAATAQAIGYATEWAKSAVPVSSGAGGSGTDLSAKSYAAQAAEAPRTRGYLFGAEIAQNSGDATFSLDISAGLAMTDDTTPVLMVIPAVTRSVNAAYGAGGTAGRFDSAVSDGTWHIYAGTIDGTTVVVGMSKLLNPTTAPNWPAGYTKFRRLDSRVRIGGAWKRVEQRGDKHLIYDGALQNSGSPITTGTSAQLLALTGIPTGIEVDVRILVSGTSATLSAGMLITSPLVADMTPGAGQVGGINVGHIQVSNGFFSAELWVRTNTLGQIRHRAGAAGSLYITVHEWVDTRGGVNAFKGGAQISTARGLGSAILSADYVTLQEAINAAAGKRLIIEAGSYPLTTGLTGVDNIQIESNGPVELTTSADITMLDMTNCENWSLQGLFRFVGDGVPYTGYPGSLADTGQKGIKLSNSDRYLIDGVEFENINGSALFAELSAGGWQHKGIVKGIRARSCFHGIRYTNFAEYDDVSDFSIDNCTFAVLVESGNILFSNGKMNFNSICVKLKSSSGNEAHGTFTNCQMNHSNYAISAESVVLGEVFNGCIALGNQGGSGHGKFQIIGSNGIVWNGGQIGCDIALTGNSKMAIMNAYIRTGLVSAPTVEGGSSLKAKSNYTDTGDMWAYNN